MSSGIRAPGRFLKDSKSKQISKRLKRGTLMRNKKLKVINRLVKKRMMRMKIKLSLPKRNGT